MDIGEKIQEWVDKNNLWKPLCEDGVLMRLSDISAQTGISESLLLEPLQAGIAIRGVGNRVQRLWYISDDFVGSDSEESTRTCLVKWFSSNACGALGSKGLEVSFREMGLNMICNLAKNPTASNFVALRSCLVANGIDLVAFSERRKEVWVVEIKGWTTTDSDFNETIHQICNRIIDLLSYCGLDFSIRFACAFPYFGEAQDWRKKLENLRQIPREPTSLLLFSSATCVKKADGETFLRRFIEGPIKVVDLIRENKLHFLLVRSPKFVEDVITRQSMDQLL